MLLRFSWDPDYNLISDILRAGKLCLIQIQHWKLREKCRAYVWLAGTSSLMAFSTRLRTELPYEAKGRDVPQDDEKTFPKPTTSSQYSPRKPCSSIGTARESSCK